MIRTFLLVLGVLASLANVGLCQGGSGQTEMLLEESHQQLDMVVNSSRIVRLNKEIPRAFVDNQDVVRVTPLSASKVRLSAAKTGVTQVTLYDADGDIYTLDVVVVGDSRELELLLKSEFPQASLRVRPLANSVILTGRVDKPEVVNRIVRIAEDYYPKVINNISVGGVQQVNLHVKVMEVSRSKLRTMGIDWANFGSSDSIAQSVSGVIAQASIPARSVVTSGNETLSLGLVGSNNSFFAFMEALREHNLAKVLAEPTLTTVSGRPASFNAGGEFPILVPQSLGTTAIEFKEFGTRVDFVPIVLGNGHIRLEVRPQVSELDAANGVTINGTVIPALRTRWVDTAVEMRAGQTLALAGLIQTKTEAQNLGLPWLSDLPWAGAAFRRTREIRNEIELVVLVRPELVDALDPHEVPACGPGERTTSPSDVELHFRGYLEVPNCCDDGSCPSCQAGQTVSEYPNYSNQYSAPYSGQPEYSAPYSSQPEYSAPAVEVPDASPLPPSANRPNRYNATGVKQTSYQSPTVGRQTVEQNSQNRYRSTNAQQSNSESSPGLFGRVGYDVLNYRD
ncbi:MAG: type II and III secretion system protein family protein [Planctomycetales bacterium]|nr:type II and III secretion system protein family protein [Planctomycetales bacterium]